MNFRLLIFLVFSYNLVNAQENRFSMSFGTNYAQFDLENIRDNHIESLKTLENEYGIDFYSYDNLNSNFGFWGEFYFQKKPESIFKSGISFQYAKAFGRNGYKDYSGHIYYDNKITSLILFISNKVSVLEINEKINFSLELNTGISIINNSYRYEIEILNAGKSIEKVSFSPKNFALNPGIELQYFVSSSVFLKSKFGYLFDISGNNFSNSNDGSLLSAEGDGPSIDMSGLRIGIGVGFCLD